MNFEYLRTETFLDSIDIEDIGNCTINVINDDAYEWYLGIRTELGWTRALYFGPLKVDEDRAAPNFSIIHNEFEYGDKKLYKYIRDFINDNKKSITQVFLIEDEEFQDRLDILADQLTF